MLDATPEEFIFAELKPLEGKQRIRTIVFFKLRSVKNSHVTFQNLGDPIKILRERKLCPEVVTEVDNFIEEVVDGKFHFMRDEASPGNAV